MQGLTELDFTKNKMAARNECSVPGSLHSDQHSGPSAQARSSAMGTQCLCGVGDELPQ